MRSVTEHAAAVLDLVAPLPAVDVPPHAALGHVLAEDLRAAEALPRWDNSAMDGYAVRAADVATAEPSAPVVLRVVADLAAGSGAEPHVEPGTAARIMTGAPVPPGADAVVPVEHTDGGTTTVRVDRAPRPGAHVRRAGEDVAVGDLVLAAGTELGPTHVAAAASVNAGLLRVHRRPRVVVVSTGSELVPAGSPLRRGTIPDSNSVLLAAAAESAGADVLRVGAVTDDVDELGSTLRQHAATADLVLTSGGVSVGAYDVVKALLTAWGGVEFVAVAMQPGKPQGAGRLPGGTPVLCLPGNPVSAHVSFEVFVRPVLARLRGLDARGGDALARRTTRAVVDDGWRTPQGREQYMPVRLRDEDGVLHASRAARGGSGSHLVAGLAGSDALAVVPADVDVVEPGTTLRILRTDL
ncbi:molybdopterin molybdotransferase MoeA [Cellulomonas carbonis]|uniref:Molybdopterin molybdenumtransferase n=1 Tax=Cellulomonas carbonis T26 TaxID=947969 RepID=A0A0A0BSY8_9CELL|nr:gephyrin-like molybdotransferase Glp [Cellulomonas carbonis]KGM10772.1 molybdopterin molybdenumtransferase [Cellulomonas carbonis T26]GGB92592.1 molybdopterin molybdenumtransferase [Cellulomonas carbonis]